MNVAEFNRNAMERAGNEIPIFFSTDDNYIPYLDVSVASLIENASKQYQYRLVVLNTGLKQENVDKVKQNERTGFAIDFVDISKEVEKIKDRFKSVYHFSIVTYYRLFISSLFPQYDKILYLDCDIVVLGDVSSFDHRDRYGHRIRGQYSAGNSTLVLRAYRRGLVHGAPICP